MIIFCCFKKKHVLVMSLQGLPVCLTTQRVNNRKRSLNSGQRRWELVTSTKYKTLCWKLDVIVWNTLKFHILCGTTSVKPFSLLSYFSIVCKFCDHSQRVPKCDQGTRAAADGWIMLVKRPFKRKNVFNGTLDEFIRYEQYYYFFKLGKFNQQATYGDLMLTSQ